MSIDFSKVTFLKLKAKKLGYVSLTKKTFKHVIEEREREHVKYNEQLLKETLQNPDNIKEDNEDPNVHFYIKKTQKYYLKPDITTVNVRRFRYFTVLVDKTRLFIITMYPCSKILGGKQVWPHQNRN